MTFKTLLRACGASALVGATALAVLPAPALAQGRHAEQMMAEGGGAEPEAGAARERAFGQRAERRAERAAERYQAQSAPQRQPQWQPPQAQQQSVRDWSRAERRSDVAAERAGRQWNRRDNSNNDWGQARAAQAQADADARARARADAQAQGSARRWNDGDRWERNRSYGDRERNRTYRDGYRDGARQDAWRDRQQQNSAYRSGYQAGWRADNRYDRGRYGRYEDHRRWSHDWRRDNRYNWYGYRNANRNVFRLGTYYAPYRNYRYNRLSIGFQLGSLFYGSRYWINDPWQYRLPAAYGPYRWVRYYDDALLVDIHSGRVIDVIYDFFW